MSHGRAQPRHRRRKSDFFGSPAKQTSAASPVAAPEAVDDEWVRCHDAATGASYYANRRSFEVSWTPPPSRTPSVTAPTPPPVVGAGASVAAPPPARARRAADAAWIGRGTAALAKAAREAPTPVVAPPSPPVPEPPSPPTPEPTPEPPPPWPEAPPTPEPAESLYEEEFVVVDERTDSGTDEGASYEEFEEIEEVVVADDALDTLPDAAPSPPPVAAPIEPGPAPGSAPPTTLGSVEGDGDAAMADTPAAVPPEPAPAPAAPPARRKTAQELLAALVEVSERLAPYAAAFAPAPRKGALLGPRGAPTRRGRALLAAARRCRA